MTPTIVKAYSYIRFSTPEQLKGDSLRRQIEATEAYCKEKGYTLDTSLTLRDLGLSAFNGKHRTKGALGEFIRLVNEGQITPGSLLIVENLDRLSREDVMDAFDQFRALIKAGITLVTLQDRMEYNHESIKNNWSQLIISITYMARAHDESLSKSKRLKSAWEQKRKNAKQKPLTAKIPAWIRAKYRIIDEKTKILEGFEIIPEVQQAVELIYDMKLSGTGVNTIEKGFIKCSQTMLNDGMPIKKVNQFWKTDLELILYFDFNLFESLDNETKSCMNIPAGLESPLISQPLVTAYPTYDMKREKLLWNTIDPNPYMNGFGLSAKQKSIKEMIQRVEKDMAVTALSGTPEFN